MFKVAKCWVILLSSITSMHIIKLMRHLKNWKRQINVFLLSGSGFEGPWPWPWGGPWESPSKGVMFKCSSMHSKEGKVSLCYRLFNRSLCQTLTFWKKVRKRKLPVEDRSFLLTVFMSVQLIPGTNSSKDNRL